MEPDRLKAIVSTDGFVLQADIRKRQIKQAVGKKKKVKIDVNKKEKLIQP